MFKPPKRAVRRSQRERMIRRALTVLDLQGWHLDEPEKMRRKALRWADNIAICSCYSCCNVRRGLEHRLTRAELRQELELLEWRLRVDE